MVANVIEKLKNLDPVNKAYIEKYIRHLKLKQLKQKTIDTKVWRGSTPSSPRANGPAVPAAGGEGDGG